MDKRVLKIAYRRLAAMLCEDDGAVLVITLAIFFFLFMLVSSVYAIGEAVHRRIELQNTCDAAAYSAAVVQADGLSRMATVNRAMAWTYVQMVRRQMDYITYRWLKLTYKNFEEDRKAAKKWHMCLLPCDKSHKKEGTGWWCGQGAKGGMDKIRLNYRFELKRDELKDLLDDLDDSMGDGNIDDEIGGADDFFSGNDDMFKVRDDLSGDKKKIYDEVVSRSADGKEMTEDDIRGIYMDFYKEDHPEPPKYVKNLITGREELNPDWSKWELEFQLFADRNRISESDTVCRYCGKSISGNHSKCMEKQMKDFFAAAEEEEKAEAAIPQPARSSSTSKYGWGKNLAEQIKNDKQAIEMMNTSLDAINMNMMLGIREAAQEILQMNLPKTAEGEIPDDFYYTLHIPTGGNPYAQTENDDESLAGVFSPLYNTEEHETLFLNMMDNEVHDSLLEYFASGKTGSGLINLLKNGGRSAGGLDQWFIRSYPEETMIANQKNIEPTGESYHAEGISRSYKNANRKEGSGLLGHSRANHVVSIADNVGVRGGSDLFGLMDIFGAALDSIKQEIDLAPSCINRRARFPEMCGKIDDSVGLVSQYRWCSAKWFCFFVVYPFGIKWFHPFFPKFFCSNHGYGKIWVGKEVECLFDGGMTRNNYRPCYIGLDDTFIFKGHARIYGDDRDLVDEQYIGAPARPWLLNEKFFGGDGTITVGLARRQRNPWQRIMSWFYGYDAKSPNLSSGLMSLFNVKKDNFLWTASTARAAYRRNSDGMDSGELNYDMKFDASTFPDALEIDYADDATSDMKALRVGCVCDNDDNKARLEKSWNLSTPDWDATLLPVRYSRNFIGKYESWKNKGGATNWTAVTRDSGDDSDEGGVFRMLAGEKWMGFGDNASDVTAGRNIMGSENIYGLELNNWDELEKLKIY